jgi:ketosteroid isomerase-like protein
MSAATPAELHRLFEDRFNADDIDGLMELYESNAVRVAQPDDVSHGSAGVRAALVGLLALKQHHHGSFTLIPKLRITVGELAFLSAHWTLRGTNPEGTLPVGTLMEATTAEVVRRQSDGTWRYVIDNAWGDQAVS